MDEHRTPDTRINFHDNCKIMSFVLFFIMFMPMPCIFIYNKLFQAVISCFNIHYMEHFFSGLLASRTFTECSDPMWVVSVKALRNNDFMYTYFVIIMVPHRLFFS